MLRSRTMLLLVFVVLAPRVNAQRAIPDDNLGYPVLIKLTDCSSNIASAQASGFFLNTGSEEYLVTSSHVLFNESERVELGHGRRLQCNKAELVSYSKDPKDTQPNRMQLDLRVLNGAGKVKAHVTHDVAVIQLGVAQVAQTEGTAGSQKMYAARVNPAVEITTLAASGIVVAGMDVVKKFDEVLTANDVYVFGYPSSIGMQQVPQIDYSKPLLRKGIVAGKNESNKTLVLDCLTFFGNSGGPVLQAVRVGLGTRFDVVGVISQYVPVTETWVNTTLSYGYAQIHNSGYSIAEPMDSAIELIGR